MNDWQMGKPLTDDTPAHCLRRPTLMTACAFFLLAAMGVTAMRVLSQCSGYVAEKWRQLVVSGGSSLIQALFLGLPPVLYRRKHPGVEAALRLRTPKASAVLAAVGAGLCGVFLTNDLNTLWTVFLQSTGLRITLESAGSSAWTPFSWIYALFAYALVPAVCEELLFRGALFGAWERRGTVRAWVVSGALFVLLHGSLQALPGQVLAAFTLGYLVITTHSLYTGMICHFVHNAGILLFARLPAFRLDPGLGETLYFSIGGAAGIALYALRALLLTGLFALVLIFASSEREKSGRPFSREGEMDRTALPWRETVVLSSGIVTALSLLLINALRSMRIL